MANPVILGTISQPMNTAPIAVTQTNNFIVIPEPSTANLFIVVAGMMWAMRVHMRRSKVAAAEPGQSDAA
jgi:hypothetical protein